VIGGRNMCKLLGKTKEIATKWDADPSVQKVIAKRIAPSMGTLFHADEFEAQVELSARGNKGVPNWGNIVDLFTDQVKRSYQGKRIKL